MFVVVLSDVAEHYWMSWLCALGSCVDVHSRARLFVDGAGV